MKQSALVLLKVDEDKDFISVFEMMRKMENIIWCEATRGDIDIFMKIEGDSSDKCLQFFNTSIKPVKEIKNSIFLPVLETVTTGVVETTGQPVLKSFILAEMDPNKLNSLTPLITSEEIISSCDFVMGAFNVVLTVAGNQFVQFDKFISNKLINLDGVIKLKEYPIINIYEN